LLTIGAPVAVYEVFSYFLPDLGVRTSPWNDRGLYHPKFSSAGCLHAGTYPDHGLAEGKIPILIHGERLLPDMAVKLDNPLLFSGMGKKMNNYPASLLDRSDGSLYGNPFVSERFRGAVEQMEPGVHQFIPTAAAKFDTKEPLWTNTDWYYFILNWIGPNRLFKTEAMEHIPNFVKRQEVPPFKLGGKEYLGRQTISYSSIIHKHIIRSSALEGPLKGKYIWITSSYVDDDLNRIRTERRIYSTSEMRKAFKNAGVKAIKFLEREIA
jgi:hypothetical protein